MYRETNQGYFQTLAKMHPITTAAAAAAASLAGMGHPHGTFLFWSSFCIQRPPAVLPLVLILPDTPV